MFFLLIRMNIINAFLEFQIGERAIYSEIDFVIEIFSSYLFSIFSYILVDFVFYLKKIIKTPDT
ncbi:hypothetical protein MYP_3251 [Sporocytophaga myxococcoides]|uniref:Uncharacterized protein n=1 Tax=Sporocytophaga myxococcoides TaxID=153721 RepID=A0A098LHW9_9BACT|nr:hypothetical protein MYP_3251 [Sporocytophaga myxococcoides]